MKTYHRQEGMTLLMALIMLIVLTMLALTSFNLSKPNVQIVSNMQQRDEAIAAAQEVLEEVVSSIIFSKTPDHTLSTPCDNDANSRCVDTNGDNVVDVRVRLTPQPNCIGSMGMRNSTLDVEDPEEVGCIAPKDPALSGTADAINDDSQCANTNWEITAVATDELTQSKVTIKQGLAMTTALTDVATNCL